MSDATTEPFGLERARELLAAAVETQGRDFVYSPEGPNFQCFNGPVPAGTGMGYGSLGDRTPTHVAEGAPRTKTGCLVGTAFTLAGLEHHLEEELINGGVNVVRTAAGREWFDTDAAEYFIIAQGVQDKGGSWGKAYDDAEAYIRDKGWVK